MTGPQKVTSLVPKSIKDRAKKRGRPRVERSKGKFPWFKFWPDAWLSDPGLMCTSMAAQGLWINILAQIHKQAEGGEITRSVRQLSRMFRIDIAQLLVLLDELAETGTAAVTYIKVHPETGELLVDNPVDKFVEGVIKSNLSQFVGNESKLNFSDQVFISILSRRMKRDQIHRDTERLRKRRLRDNNPET